MWKPKETRSSYRFRSQVGVPQPTEGDDFQPIFLMNQQYCVGVCLVGLGKKSTSTCLPAFLISVLKKKNMMFLPNYHAISRPKSACHTSTSLLKNNQGKIPLFSGEKKTWRDQNCPYHSRFQVRYTTNAYISCAENSPIVGFVGFIPQLTWRSCHPLEAGRDVPWFQSTIEA